MVPGQENVRHLTKLPVAVFFFFAFCGQKWVWQWSVSLINGHQEVGGSVQRSPTKLSAAATWRMRNVRTGKATKRTNIATHPLQQLQYLAANFIAQLCPAQNIEFIYQIVVLRAVRCVSCQQIGKRNCCLLENKSRREEKTLKKEQHPNTGQFLRNTEFAAICLALAHNYFDC